MRKRKHRLLSLFMIFSMVLALLPLSTITVLAAWDGSVEISDWYGGGTATDYYIDTPAELAGLAVIVNGTDDPVDGFTGQDSFNGKKVTLNAELDLTGYDWIPIGTPGNAFEGTFHGGGHSISNLSIGTVGVPDAVLIHMGLFGNTGPLSVIKNLSLEDVTIYSALGTDDDFAYIGALAGHSSGAIENCQSLGVLHGGYKSTVGGLVGWLGDFSGNGSIEDCTSSCAVKSGDGPSSAGGLIGCAENTEVSGSSANGGSVTCGSSIGATGYPMAGGLIGSVSGATVTDCFAEGAVRGGSGSIAGGFCGYNDGSIRGSNARGDVLAYENSTAGGFVGSNITTDDTLVDCEATGSVSIGSAISGRSYGGGFVGKSSGGNIIDCISRGPVVGGESRAETGTEINAAFYAGGFAGYIEGDFYGFNTVQNCFAYGNVVVDGALFSGSADSTSNLYAGGFVGYGDCARIEQCAALGEETSADSFELSGSGNTGGVYVGGFGGMVFGRQRTGYARQGIIVNCYARGQVSARVGANLGGFAGGCIAQDDEYGTEYDAFALILNSYSTAGTLFYNSANVGGFVGYLQNANIVNSYAAGRFTSESTEPVNVGGFAGNIATYEASDLLANTYYNSGSADNPLECDAVGINTSGQSVLIQGLLDTLMRGETAGSVAYDDGDGTVEAPAFLDALNGGIGLVNVSTGTYTPDVLTWVADSVSVNDGYPIFGEAWAAPEPTLADVANNTVGVNPSTAARGTAVVITAEGSRQNDTPTVMNSTRYIPVSWSSNEAGNPGGAFALSAGSYTVSYTPATAGTYTITALFRLQGWDGEGWFNAPDDYPGATDTKTTTLTVIEESIPATASAANNTVSVNPSTVTAGSPATITAAGDRQSAAGAVIGDERYVTTTWTSTEAGKNGTFTVTGSVYASDYTSSAAGSYTITATFQKQAWDGSTWNNVSGSTDTKTTALTVTTAPVPAMANAASNTVSVNLTSVTAGSSTTITAAGDRQSVAGAVYGDERYIPTIWTSTEAGKNGTFIMTGGNYTSVYISSTVGSYTITATFQKQTWDESVWNNAVGATDTKTIVLTVNRSGGGNGGGSSNTGNTTTAGTSQTGLGSVTMENGTATATVDSAKLAEKISGSKPGDIIVFAITGNVNKVGFNLTVADLKAIADNGSMLQLESSLGIYKLPATEIDFNAISKQYPNISDKDIKVTVAFSKADGSNAILNGSKLVGQPISITVSLVAGDKAIELDEFTKYVERDLPVPDGLGFTAGVVIEKDGTLRPVPTKTVTINGKKYAALFSRTNSVYALASKQVSFDDMEGHWAKAAVNDLASRLVISGVGNNRFAPGRDITRAEFAAIVVRAMGLKASDSPAFTDVKASSWYYGAVAAAYKYGIVSGYGDGTFKPDSKITRQEAMAMIARAMKVAGLDTTITNEAAAAELAKFIDGKSFSTWARQQAAAVIRSGLVVGSEGYAGPEKNITCAETAVIVRRLLEKAGLI